MPVPAPTDAAVPRTMSVSRNATWPTRAEIRQVLPDHVFHVDTRRSLAHLALSVVATAIPAVLAIVVLPTAPAAAPLWTLHALATGTAAFGLWIIAHECGHGAFSRSTGLQNAIGFLLHSLLLVPYFSWQRTHAIHHAKTNHLVDGESHVPVRNDMASGRLALSRRRRLGRSGYAVYNIVLHLVLGWPIYLLTGAVPSDGGGRTNHFWPWRPFTNRLFPARYRLRVVASTIGVATVVGLLCRWAVETSPLRVALVYGGPWLVVNAWLVVYTWLHHTDSHTPHLDDEEWTFVRGAFCSIDRPYGRVLDTLHHRIGSTHVAHHLFPRIPHYRAAEATEALTAAFPGLYRYDRTPIVRALWRLGTDCVAVSRTTDGWRYVAQEQEAAGAAGVVEAAEAGSTN